jgi:tetratricopeptide (TPR) repeat protein
VNEKQGRFNFARLDYTNLLKLVPGNFEAQLGLALLNQKDKHYTEAFDEINRLVEQFPDSAVAYAARAGIEKERKMLELAEFDYTKAINKDGSNHDYILNRADIRIQLGKFDDAKDDLDRLVKMGVPRASMKEYYMRIK